MHIKIKRKRKE